MKNARVKVYVLFTILLVLILSISQVLAAPSEDENPVVELEETSSLQNCTYAPEWSPTGVYKPGLWNQTSQRQSCRI